MNNFILHYVFEAEFKKLYVLDMVPFSFFPLSFYFHICITKNIKSL